MKRLTLFAGSALLVLSSCAPKSEAPAAAANPDRKPTVVETQSPNASKSGPVAGKDSPPAVPDKAATVNSTPASAPLTVPDSLKHDAYAYYGLENSKPVNVTVVDSLSKESRPGTRQCQLVEIKGGKATYVIKQSGGLQDNGDVTISLESNGIYAMGTTVGTMKSHSIEMPAKLEVGSGWKDHTEIKADQREINLDNDLKIKGLEKVTVPTGTFEAMVITSTGKGTMSKIPVTLTTKSWYVKGRGAVKQVISVTQPGQPTHTLTVSEAK